MKKKQRLTSTVNSISSETSITGTCEWTRGVSTSCIWTAGTQCNTFVDIWNDDKRISQMNSDILFQDHQTWYRLRFSRLGTIKYFILIYTSLDVKRLRSIWERELRDKARLCSWVDSKMGQSTFRANILLINNYSPKWRLFWLGGE